TAQTRKFDEVIANIATERAEFERLFREACLALGAYCASVDAATALSNAIGGWPQHRNAIDVATRDLNPLPPVVNGGGLRGTQQYGWNMSFAVMPLRPIGDQ